MYTATNNRGTQGKPGTLNGAGPSRERSRNSAITAQESITRSEHHEQCQPGDERPAPRPDERAYDVRGHQVRGGDPLERQHLEERGVERQIEDGGSDEPAQQHAR